MQKLDFRTLPCPQPVVQARNFLKENLVESLEIQVDNEPAVENVTRYLEQQGFSVSSQAQGSDFLLTAHKDPTKIIESTKNNKTASAKTIVDQEKILVFISTEYLGLGSDELGEKLMTTFLSTLPEMGEDLWRIVLLNGGVKLAVERNDSLKHLQALENNHVSILVCGTCLNHYNLLEKKAVGATSNMLDIVTSLQLADKVIKV